MPVQKDVRVTIISRVWASATAMLLIAMLLNGQGRERGGLFLSAAIVVGATISTIVVLRRVRDSPHGIPSQSEALEAFKQRIENLEAIATTGAGQWESSLKQLDQSTSDL